MCLMVLGAISFRNSIICRMIFVNIPWTSSNPAITCDEESISFGNLHEALTSGRKGFALAGIQPGAPFPMQVGNAVGDVILLLSVLARGAIAAPINTRWPFEQVSRVSERLVPPKPPLTRRAGQVPALEDDWRLIVHTSGSGGDAKAAVLSSANCSASARTAIERLGLGAGDRWLLSLPLYHVGGIGIVMRCLSAGATIVALEAEESLEEALARYELTHVSLVATQLYRLLQDDKAAEGLAAMKAVLLGGGPVPEGLVREAVERGIPIYASYGMTETASMIACTMPGDLIERLLSSGRPLVEDTVSISDEGEILVRGETLFQGYLRPDGTLDRPLTADGWFATGDLGFFDDEGYLHVTGRRDNMFVSGGENIQPEEIERRLCALEGVEEAMVVAVDDEEWGQRPVAYVRMASGALPEAGRLAEELRDVLPGYMIPRAVLPWPEGIVTGGIKASRAELTRRARDA